MVFVREHTISIYFNGRELGVINEKITPISGYYLEEFNHQSEYGDMSEYIYIANIFQESPILFLTFSNENCMILRDQPRCRTTDESGGNVRGLRTDGRRAVETQGVPRSACRSSRRDFQPI